MRRLAFTAMCALAGLLALSGSARDRVQRLEVVDARGTVVWAAPVGDGEAFDVSFVHSHERVRWMQHYAVRDPGGIYQAASSFASFGAGMPPGSAPILGRTSSRDYAIYAGHRFSSILFMHSQAADMTLHFRSQSLPLNRWFRQHDSFTIRIR